MREITKKRTIKIVNADLMISGTDEKFKLCSHSYCRHNLSDYSATSCEYGLSPSPLIKLSTKCTKSCNIASILSDELANQVKMGKKYRCDEI